jgi:succinate-acetate transporter protein
MWEFRNRNVFGSTAFSTYGGFWIGLGAFVVLVAPNISSAATLESELGFIVFAFAVFNTYMLLWSTRTNLAVLGVFATLEATEIILFWAYWAHAATLLKVGGWVGVATAAVAWYASAAGVVNGMAGHTVVPVGRALWGGRELQVRPGSPLPRVEASHSA